MSLNCNRRTAEIVTDDVTCRILVIGKTHLLSMEYSFCAKFFEGELKAENECRSDDASALIKLG